MSFTFTKVAANTFVGLRPFWRCYQVSFFSLLLSSLLLYRRYYLFLFFRCCCIDDFVVKCVCSKAKQLQRWQTLKQKNDILSLANISGKKLNFISLRIATFFSVCLCLLFYGMALKCFYFMTFDILYFFILCHSHIRRHVNT
jgi:hypothetical protein